MCPQSRTSVKALLLISSSRELIIPAKSLLDCKFLLAIVCRRNSCAWELDNDGSFVTDDDATDDAPTMK